MLANQSSRTMSHSTERPLSGPCIVVFPFYSYMCEFVPKEISQGEWIIRHRDSAGKACVSVKYRDSQSQEVVWRVRTTLCQGTAEFRNQLNVEMFIATMLRCNAGRNAIAGKPRSGLSLDELWWLLKSALRGRNRFD